VLWMAGGMASTETFDPKHYLPYEKGMEPKGLLSTFPAIDTAVDNIKLSQGLEKIGAVMDPGGADPDLHRGRPWGLSSTRAPVPVAYRLRTAAERGRAAHWRR